MLIQVTTLSAVRREYNIEVNERLVFGRPRARKTPHVIELDPHEIHCATTAEVPSALLTMTVEREDVVAWEIRASAFPLLWRVTDNGKPPADFAPQRGFTTVHLDSTISPLIVWKRTAGWQPVLTCTLRAGDTFSDGTVASHLDRFWGVLTDEWWLEAPRGRAGLTWQAAYTALFALGRTYDVAVAPHRGDPAAACAQALTNAGYTAAGQDVHPQAVRRAWRDGMLALSRAISQHQCPAVTHSHHTCIREVPHLLALPMLAEHSSGLRSSVVCDIPTMKAMARAFTSAPAHFRTLPH